MHKKSGGTTKVHLHLVLSEYTMSRINFLKGAIEADSYSEVVREAVRLYYELINGTGISRAVILRRDDDTLSMCRAVVSDPEPSRDRKGGRLP